MAEMRHAKVSELKVKHKSEQEGYEYYKRDFVPRGHADKSMVSIYEIPPLKAAIHIIIILKMRKLFILSAGKGY